MKWALLSLLVLAVLFASLSSSMNKTQTKITSAAGYINTCGKTCKHIWRSCSAVQCYFWRAV